MSWPTVKLGDVCEISRGGSPRPIQDYITENADGLNWIKIGDVKEGDKYITHTAEKIKPSGLSHTREIKPGDFLLSNSMSYGRPYISKISGCIHDGWLMLRDVHGNFSQDYLYHMLTSRGVKEQFAKYATGAVVKNLNKDVVSKVIVPLPPLEEQLKIAAILDIVDQIRLKRIYALNKLDELGNSIFSHLCGGDKFGVTVKLKDLVIKGKPKECNNSVVWSLSLEQIQANTGQILNEVYVKKSELGSSTYYFEPPVILYSKLRPYLNKVAIPTKSGYATTELVPLYCNQKIVRPSFFVSYLRSNSFVQFANTNSGGAKMPRVMMDKFWDHELNLPSMGDQIAFEQKFEKINNQREIHMRAVMQLSELFLSLQHRAFTTGFN